MWGGESRTDTRILTKGTILFHNSNKQIKYFEEKGFPESTCFFTEDRGNGKYRYIVTLKKDIKVGVFGEEEVRFDPTNSKCEIVEIGTNRKLNICD